MKVLFFAQSRMITGCEDYILQTDVDMTQPEFWMQLIDRFPGLEVQRKGARLARREAYLNETELLYPEDEVAVIPPVSGG